VVKRLTEDKVLRADVRLADADSVTPRVILYDKQTNINSVVAQRKVTFTSSDISESSHVTVFFFTSGMRRSA